MSLNEAKLIVLKGTVSVFSSDPQCIDGKAIFTTVLSYPGQSFGRHCHFLGFEVFNSDNSFMLSCSRNSQVTFVQKQR